jgi:hypothetical protein
MANVVGERVAAGFEDVISARGGGCGEYELDPFATFFESFELLPTMQFLTPRLGPENTKGATGGRAFLTEFCLYIQNSKLAGVNRKGLESLYLARIHWVRGNRVVSAY